MRNILLLMALVCMFMYVETNRAWTPMTKAFYSQPLNKRGVRNKDGSFKGKEPTLAGWIQYRDGYEGDYVYNSATDRWTRSELDDYTF